MTELQTTEASHSTGKEVLTYVALAAVSVLSAVVWLWLSFSPKQAPAEQSRPWDLRLLSDLPLTDDDLQAIEGLRAVERIERDDGQELLHVWIQDNNSLTRAEEELQTLAAEREAARVEALLSAAAAAEPDAAALSELEALQNALDAQASRLAEERQRLDDAQAALRKRQAQLDEVLAGLNRDGYDLGEAELSLDSIDNDAYIQNVHQQRDLWYAAGEGFLDTLTLYEQERQKLERAEREYAAGQSAYEADRVRLDSMRAALDAQSRAEPEIEPCEWRLERNPDAGKVPAAEEAFSPTRLSLQMLFLGIAALSAWLFFARLLSAAAGSIVKPNAGGEEHSEADLYDAVEEEKAGITR